MLGMYICKWNNLNKLSIIVCLFTLLFASCSDDNLSLTQCDEDSFSQVVKRAPNEEKKEIDWGAVAIADGGGAALGCTLAKYSLNPYVIIASAAGVGAYASYCEYERQKEIIENEELDNLIYEPDIINPYRPFVQNSLLNINGYQLSLDSISTLGELHNQVVQYEYNVYKNHEGEIDRDDLLHEMLTLSGLTNSRDWINYQNDIAMYDELGWKNMYNELFDVNSEFKFIFASGTAESIHAYINDSTRDYTNEIEEEYAAMIVAYYSRCMWNTMAPDPAFTQECLVWSSNDYSLEYIIGREPVIFKILNKEDEDVFLYPAYNENGLEALYLYSPDIYGGSEEIPSHITIVDRFSANSLMFNDASFQIEPGEYEIEPTNCVGVYVINMQTI